MDYYQKHPPNQVETPTIQRPLGVVVSSTDHPGCKKNTITQPAVQARWIHPSPRAWHIGAFTTDHMKHDFSEMFC